MKANASKATHMVGIIILRLFKQLDVLLVHIFHVIQQSIYITSINDRPKTDNDQKLTPSTSSPTITSQQSPAIQPRSHELCVFFLVWYDFDVLCTSKLEKRSRAPWAQQKRGCPQASLSMMGPWGLRRVLHHDCSGYDHAAKSHKLCVSQRAAAWN